MTYDNIKSHNDNVKSNKKPGLHAFSEKYIFGKATVRWEGGEGGRVFKLQLKVINKNAF